MALKPVTVTLDPEALRAISTLQRRFYLQTVSAAVRFALRKANAVTALPTSDAEPASPTPSAVLA